MTGRADDADQRGWLIVNNASGSHREGLADELAEAFAKESWTVARVIDCASADLPSAEQASAAGIAMVAVHGGDGTLNTVARGLEGWSGAILPLPGGTSNLLCHRLFDECDAFAIIAQLGQHDLAPRTIEVLRSGGLLAISEIVAGPGAYWADVREEMRDGKVIDTLSATKIAVQQNATGPRVRIDDPELGRREGYSGLRLTVGDRGVHVDGYAQDGLRDWMEQGLAILARNFREGPHEDLGEARELTCRSTDGSSIALMIDGERHDGAGMMRFSLAPLAVDLLLPRHVA